MSDVKGPDDPMTVTNVSAGDPVVYVSPPEPDPLWRSPEGYGTIVALCGCQPVNTGKPPSVPWMPTPGQPPWYPGPPGPTVPVPDPPAAPETCRTCRWFCPDTVQPTAPYGVLYWPVVGECRAHAPSAVTDSRVITNNGQHERITESRTQFPATNADEFCGDHRPRRT